MSFELKPIEDLIRIAAAGGGFTLTSSLKPTAELVRIAAAASNSGARVTFTGLALRPTQDLVQIAAAGRGVVTLEG